MKAPKCNRRTLLAGGATALVTSTAGCAGGLLSGKSKLQKQLDKVREATKKYTDPKTALKDGFKPGGPYVPGMGWHFSHPKRGQEAAKNGFDIEKPNILTYVKTDSGLKLGSVEYGAPAKATDENPDLFADENADATEEWHTHKAATHVFATGDGSQNNPKNVEFETWVTKDNWAEFSPPDKSISAGDTVALNWGSAKGKQGETTERVADLVTTHPKLRTLHAWVHADNPDGVFSPVNPEYGGDGHSH
ncbi:hypothetical protein [Halorussus salinisoli]|uniref:hypothetical protein n=1 Tax=Halorussus salinisoli TaxID=2558242 RepID=UPI0010C1D8EA|nr:hypothetical protein [Halorussus salinisoli]